MLLEVDANAVIPAAPGRKGLVLYKHPGTPVYFGWGAPVIPAMNEPGNAGIPLPEAQIISFMSEKDRCFAQPLHLFSNGAVEYVTYQEIF